jgi:fluoroacetyl-CoA thioesterase
MPHFPAYNSSNVTPFMNGVQTFSMSSILPSAEISMIVSEEDTAKALARISGDDFPEVFATSRMIALMELAAARCLVPSLQPGQLSVGVGVEIKHLAATPMGAKVSAAASYLGQEGKLHRFKIEAFDPAGKIGEGFHSRAIIDTARLLEGAAKRR